MAYMMFCAVYPRESQVQRIAFRGRKIDLTPEHLAELSEVNQAVNRDIVPEANLLNAHDEKWVINVKKRLQRLRCQQAP